MECAAWALAPSDVAADRESYLSPSDDRATVDAVSVAAFQRIRVGGCHHGGLSVGDVTTGEGRSGGGGGVACGEPVRGESAAVPVWCDPQVKPFWQFIEKR